MDCMAGTNADMMRTVLAAHGTPQGIIDVAGPVQAGKIIK